MNDPLAPPATMIRPVGVVLAGGQSRRMGRDKALLDWQGRPLLEHMIGLLRAAGCERVVVSGERPAYAGIVDRLPGGGPLVGLLSVAATLDDGELLVVPVDMPRLPVALLQRLCAEPMQSWLALAGSPLPLRMRLDADSRAVLAELATLTAGERSLRALLLRLPGAALPVRADESAALGNCNTPDDWQEALRG